MATVKYLNERLENIPVCTVIKHGEKHKVFIQEPRHEYGINSKKGQFYLPFVDERERLINARKGLITQWKSTYSDRPDPDSICINKEVSIFGTNLWEQLTSESNGFVNNNIIFHNGIHVRSRGEMTVGEILDQLGLEYVYEPELILDGKRLSPDFVIRVPAFGCCIIVEYLGLLDDYDYLDSVKSKLGHYFKNGFFVGTNLILLCGNKNTAPSFDSIYNSIISTLANLCTIYVKQKS